MDACRLTHTREKPLAILFDQHIVVARPNGRTSYIIILYIEIGSDIPGAAVHFFDTGRFALETQREGDRGCHSRLP